MFRSSIARLLGLVLVAGASLLASPRAGAQATGNVDVSISLTNGIVILYFYPTLNVTIPVDQFTTPSPCTGTGAGRSCPSTAASATATVTPTEINVPFTAVAGTPVPTPVATAPIPLRLSNVWSVRAVSATGQTQVAITSTGTPHTLAGPGTNTLTLDAYTVTTGAACPGTASTTFTSPGLVNQQAGSVCANLGLSGAAQLGTYARTATPEFTLTATNI